MFLSWFVCVFVTWIIPLNKLLDCRLFSCTFIKLVGPIPAVAVWYFLPSINRPTKCFYCVQSCWLFEHINATVDYGASIAVICELWLFSLLDKFSLSPLTRCIINAYLTGHNNICANFSIQASGHSCSKPGKYNACIPGWSLTFRDIISTLTVIYITQNWLCVLGLGYISGFTTRCTIVQSAVLQLHFIRLTISVCVWRSWIVIT